MTRDRNVDAVVQHLNAEEDAADSAAIHRMVKAYQALRSIQDQQVALQKTEMAVRARIAEELGAKVGEIVKKEDGTPLLIQEAQGDFAHTGPSIVPCVRCVCAPSTQIWFHKTARVKHTVYDFDLSFRLEDAKSVSKESQYVNEGSGG